MARQVRSRRWRRQDPQRTCSRSALTRARASSGLDPDDQRVALPAAAAERRRADSAATPAQLLREGQDQPRAAHPDRMTERDRAAVDVDLVLGDAERLAGGDGNG